MNERNIELLTAFIDGEVTRREHIAALRLLNQSSEARKLLWQLQESSQIVKQLPAKTLPADFSTKIVDTLKKTAALPRPAEPAVPAPIRAGSRVPVRIAWAAGLLLAVGGSLFYFLHRPEEPQIVQNNDPPSNQDGSKNTPQDGPKNDVPKPPAPKVEPNPIDFAFADLKQRDQQEKLSSELSKGQAFRMDLYVSKNRPAQALNKLGRELQFQAAPSKKKDEDLHIFVENLLPADVAGFLGKLASEDKGNFERLRVQPMSNKDRELVYTRLRIEPKQFDEPREKVKLPTIIEAKNKKEQAPTPVQPKVPERPAVVLTKEDSKQIRSFVDQRVALKPNTVQILFVMHDLGQASARLSTPQDEVYVIVLEGSW
jgi:hypothetical protein